MARYWSEEARRAHSERIAAIRRERPWSEEQNQRRRDALRGKPKSNEVKAAMYASRTCGRTRNRRWKAAYEQRLAELNEQSHWDAIRAEVEARGLSPDDVKFGLDYARTGSTSVDPIRSADHSPRAAEVPVSNGTTNEAGRWREIVNALSDHAEEVGEEDRDAIYDLCQRIDDACEGQPLTAPVTIPLNSSDETYISESESD